MKPVGGGLNSRANDSNAKTRVCRSFTKQQRVAVVPLSEPDGGWHVRSACDGRQLEMTVLIVMGRSKRARDGRFAPWPILKEFAALPWLAIGHEVQGPRGDDGESTGNVEA